MTLAAAGRRDPVRESFEEFYPQCRLRLAGRARMHGLSQEDALDAAQEAMLKVFRNWNSLHGSSAGERTNYATRALLSVMIDGWRRRGREAGAIGLMCASMAPGEVESPSSSDALDRIRGLPAEQRAIVLLTHWGWKPREIAEDLALDPDHVRRQLHRARTRLRAGLSGTEGEL
ncbi:sigma-70 family RNA polymerase sigma factor [Actinoplanes sp. NPDC051851]|uniref:RNA polymerase sigma factor n=1 Tax=Actinoplanes sp. NPDC051851 TaxID=3154753 RepID=UPI003446FE8E